MKLLIFGPRDFTDRRVLIKALLESEYPLNRVTEVVCGCATGVDHMGGHWWAPEHGIRVKHFPADWKTFGNSAGPTRNGEMAHYLSKHPGSLAVGIWDGVEVRGNGSRSGTFDMIQKLKYRSIQHHIHRIDI